MAPKAGSTFAFKGVTNDDGNRTALGNEPGAVKIGTVVTVREVVKADESGAHDGKEDAVVVEWDEPSLGYDHNNNPVVATAKRAWAVGADSFDDLFEKKGS